jgi:hypothetical protein
MRWGIFLAVLGVACYIVHAILLNYLTIPISKVGVCSCGFLVLPL